MAFRCAKWLAFQTGKMFETIFLLRTAGIFLVAAREITVVLRLDFATGILRHIAPRQNPITPQGRQTLPNIALKSFIAPRTGTIINAHWFVRFNLSVERFGGTQFDF